MRLFLFEIDTCQRIHVQLKAGPYGNSNSPILETARSKNRVKLRSACELPEDRDCPAAWTTVSSTGGPPAVVSPLPPNTSNYRQTSNPGSVHKSAYAYRQPEGTEETWPICTPHRKKLCGTHRSFSAQSSSALGRRVCPRLEAIRASALAPRWAHHIAQ